MGKKKIVKIELRNPRYQKAELKDHASEFILYSRYSGFAMEGFNEHLRDAKLVPVKSDFMESFKLELETTIDNAKILYQLTKLYPSFSNWKVRAITSGVDIVTTTSPRPSVPAKKSKLTAKPIGEKTSGKVAAKKPAKVQPKKKSAKKPAKSQPKKKSAKKPAKSQPKKKSAKKSR